MPFKKVNTKKGVRYKSPSGRLLTENQVKAYYTKIKKKK